MTYDPAASTELLREMSPDGSKIVFERRDKDGLAQVVVAPIDGGRPTLQLGPSFPYTAGADFDVSPDGAKIILVAKDGTRRLMDVATGAMDDVKQPLSGLPSWQRRAP